MDFIKGLGAVILVIAIFLGLVSLMLGAVYGLGYLIGFIVNLVLGFGLVFGITIPQMFGFSTVISLILSLPVAILLNSNYEKIEKLLSVNNKKLIDEIKTISKEFRG